MGIDALPDRSELAAMLDDACRRHDVPGAALGILVGDEATTVAAGVANVRTSEPMTVDTVSQVASVTKVFTSTALHGLLDERGVALDTPICELLHELRQLDPGITVRRLFDHTSGLESDLWDDFGANGDAVSRYAAHIPAVGTIAPPGDFFSYCNTGYVALGRLAEVLGGSSFDRVLQQRLLTPLGLTHSTTRLADAVQHRLALGHDLGPAGNAPRPWIAIRALGPTGGMITTVGDLLTLARLHLDDGRDLLSADTARAMRTQSSTCGEPWTAGPGWGLGLTICTGPDGEPVAGHDGLWIGAGAYVRFIPGLDVAIAMVGAAGHARTVWHDVYADLVGRLGMRAPAPPAPRDLAIDVDRYVGRFQRLSQDYEVDVRDGVLHLTTTPTGPVAALSSPTTVAMHPVERDMFVARASTGVDMPVVFFDAGGAHGTGPAGYLYAGMRGAPRVR